MIPSRFSLTNQFPSQPAPRGLNYYIHAKQLPSTFQFYSVLDNLYRMNGRVAGQRTDGIHEVVQDWLPPMNMVERDRLYALGYNYVGRVYGQSAVIWGQQVQGSDYTLIDVMVVPDLLTTISHLHNITAGFRAMTHMPIDDSLVGWGMRNDHDYVAVVATVMQKFIEGLIYERRILGGDYRHYDDSVDIHIKSFLNPEPVVLEFEMTTGKWKLNYVAERWINAGLSVYPEMIELNLHCNFTNYNHA